MAVITRPFGNGLDAQLWDAQNACERMRETLRDQFASAALQGAVSTLHHWPDTHTISKLATFSYAMADQMLMVRSEKP